MNSKTAVNLKWVSITIIIMAALELFHTLMELFSSENSIRMQFKTYNLSESLLTTAIAIIVIVLIIAAALRVLDGLLGLKLLKKGGKAGGLIVLTVILLIFDAIAFIQQLLSFTKSGVSIVDTVISTIALAAFIYIDIMMLKCVKDFKAETAKTE